MRLTTTGLKVLAMVMAVGVAACSDDSLPTEPVESGPPTFSLVQSLLAEDCSGCHAAGTLRIFTVDMDSAAFVISGLINSAEPAKSLILTKPRSLAHGGGVIASFLDDDIAQIQGWIGLQPFLNLNVVEAVRVGSRVAPNSDGYANEAVWRQAPTIVAPLGGGWADAQDVTLSAAYDDEYIYLLARWYDDAESTRRSPWVKNADGSWSTLSAKPTPQAGIPWADYMHAGFEEEDYFYEDKFAMIWNTYGATTIAGFDEQGCASICHDPVNNFGPGTTYNYDNQNLAAKKYTNAPGEIGDIWHWKLVRQNQHNKIDDQYVGYWTQGGADPGHAGRHTDAGSGGYGSNPATNGVPTYRGPSLTGPPYYILNAEKMVVTQAELDGLPVGAMLPNMITSGPTDLRADVDAHGVYNPANQLWTVEIRRKLVTGDSHDVQFDDLTREYAFGTAVFDNAQIEHSWNAQVYKLKFVN